MWKENGIQEQMKTFSDNTRCMMLTANNGYCAYPGCFNKATEFHHKFPNTTVNQRLYPLFLQSPFNCMPICNDCHMVKPKIKIREQEAIAFEVFLQEISNDNKNRR